MSSNTVYLITGSNKGIGRTIVTLLLARPNTTVIATVRDPSDPTSASLPSLHAAAGSKVVLIKLVADLDYQNLHQTLAAQGITYINTAIANAGNSSGFKNVLQSTANDVRYDFEANTIGTLKLFQAVWPLLESGLQQGGNVPGKFIVMSSSVGSIAGQEQEAFPSTAYGMSKTALNYLAKKISLEHKEAGLVVGILHPGWVKTRMGQVLADSIGFKEPPMELEDSAKNCLAVIDAWNMENTGKFLSYDGSELPW